MVCVRFARFFLLRVRKYIMLPRAPPQWSAPIDIICGDLCHHLNIHAWLNEFVCWRAFHMYRVTVWWSYNDQCWFCTQCCSCEFPYMYICKGTERVCVCVCSNFYRNMTPNCHLHETLQSSIGWIYLRANIVDMNSVYESHIVVSQSTWWLWKIVAKVCMDTCRHSSKTQAYTHTRTHMQTQTNASQTKADVVQTNKPTFNHALIAIKIGVSLTVLLRLIIVCVLSM